MKVTKTQILETLEEFSDQRAILIKGEVVDIYSFSAEALDCAATNIVLQIKTESSEGEEAIGFAEWLIENHMSFDGFGGWTGKINTSHYGSKSSDLYNLYKSKK